MLRREVIDVCCLLLLKSPTKYTYSCLFAIPLHIIIASYRNTATKDPYDTRVLIKCSLCVYKNTITIQNYRS
jgi:hypothetical protein